MLHHSCGQDKTIAAVGYTKRMGGSKKGREGRGKKGRKELAVDTTEHVSVHAGPPFIGTAGCCITAVDKAKR